MASSALISSSRSKRAALNDPKDRGAVKPLIGAVLRCKLTYTMYLCLKKYYVVKVVYVFILIINYYNL